MTVLLYSDEYSSLSGQVSLGDFCSAIFTSANFYIPNMVMVRVMVFNATFNNILDIGQFYWMRKSKYPEKTTDLP
jgi:hypothetical protein